MKTLGIIGGLGPQTTTKIYHSIIDSFRKNGLERYPSIVIYNLPFPFAIENEAIIEGRNAEKMIPYLVEGAKILEKSGATFGILPCNTLHKFIEKIRESVKIPFLSILDETSEVVASLNVKSVGVLATQSSVNDRLYDSILQKNKIKVIYPSKNVQHDLDKLIIQLINNSETKNVAYQVIELNLDQKILRPEELIAFARETEEEVIWDVTNGFEDAYISIVAQICKSFKPDYIVCPLGSGGIYMGIIEGVEKYSPTTKVLGIGVKSVYQSVADKLSTPWSPYTRAIETKNANGHMVFRLSEDEIKKAFYQYKNIATAEVSATVVYAAPTLYKFKPTDKVVFINSGKLMPKITA